MNEPNQDAYLAGRLIQWGLRVQSRPTSDPEYQELIDRYQSQVDFRELVQAVAEGLELMVLTAGPQGIVFAPTEKSAFALKGGSFRASSSKAEDRLLDGLIQVAIAATVFPRSGDLEPEALASRPPVTVNEVEENLRELCVQLEEQQQNQPDLPTDQQIAGLYEAWRVYQSRLATQQTKSGRVSSRSTRRMIQFNLERLRELGCFVKLAQGKQPRYQPTHRYLVQVQEFGASRLYQYLANLQETESVF